MYRDLGFICLDTRKNIQQRLNAPNHIGWTEYLSTIHLNPKLNLDVNCTYYIPCIYYPKSRHL